MDFLDQTGFTAWLAMTNYSPVPLSCFLEKHKQVLSFLAEKATTYCRFVEESIFLTLLVEFLTAELAMT